MRKTINKNKSYNSYIILSQLTKKHFIMKKKFTFRQKFRYFFENTLSKGTISIIIWLAILSLLVLLISSTIIVVVGISNGPTQMGFIQAIWESFMMTMDAGNLAGDFPWGFRFLGLFVTLGGIFILSTLIGALTTGLEAKIENLRKGRSVVIESNHTLIMGWSSKIFCILSELIQANENLKKSAIVVMAEMDKVEMEDEIRKQIPDSKNSKIICRTGSPMDIVDLEIINHQEAKAIIILSPENDNPDIEVIKSVLALTNNPKRKKEKYHIIAEIKDANNMEAARLVGGNEASYILSSDIIARLTAQTCRQSGLSIIYTDLLDFQGDEIYICKEKSLVGKTFKEITFAYNDSTVLGIMNKNNEVVINPAMDKVIEDGEQIILISQDDDTIKLSGKSDFQIKKDIIGDFCDLSFVPEKISILGWNIKGAPIVLELDKYVKVGSELVVCAQYDGIEEIIENLKNQVKNLRIKLVQEDITKNKTLTSLEVEKSDDVIILGYPDENIQEADAKTLICLLHLRNISLETGKSFNIVSEMYDEKNRQLAEITKAEDFIISDNVIALMISQLSENQCLQKVFDVLFSAEGSEIYLKPLSEYIKPGNDCNFYTIMESCCAKNQIAIGYRLYRFKDDDSKNHGIRLNPNKSEVIHFEENDRIIVLSEN